MYIYIYIIHKTKWHCTYRATPVILYNDITMTFVIIYVLSSLNQWLPVDRVNAVVTWDNAKSTSRVKIFQCCSINPVILPYALPVIDQSCFRYSLNEKWWNWTGFIKFIQQYNSDHCLWVGTKLTVACGRARCVFVVIASAKSDTSCLYSDYCYTPVMVWITLIRFYVTFCGVMMPCGGTYLD